MGRMAALHDELSEGAVAAADVDPACLFGRRDPVQEAVADEHAPSAHHIFVAGAVIEDDLGVGRVTHGMSLWS